MRADDMRCVPTTAVFFAGGGAVWKKVSPLVGGTFFY
jgi:hypothetical protein